MSSTMVCRHWLVEIQDSHVEPVIDIISFFLQGDFTCKINQIKFHK